MSSGNHRDSAILDAIFNPDGVEACNSKSSIEGDLQSPLSPQELAAAGSAEMEAIVLGRFPF